MPILIRKNEKQACIRARRVLQACREMGLDVRWSRSKISASEYVMVGGLKIRFSDHKVSETYQLPIDDSGHQFEVGLTYDYDHENIDGTCYEAIAWVAESFGREIPEWVLRKGKLKPPGEQ